MAGTDIPQSHTLKQSGLKIRIFPEDFLVITKNQSLFLDDSTMSQWKLVIFLAMHDDDWSVTVTLLLLFSASLCKW